MTTRIALTLLALTFLAGCTGEGEFEECGRDASCEAPVETSSPLTLPNGSPVPAESPESSPAPEIAASPSGGGEPVLSFTMPDLRGENLQSAQNRVQEYGVFLSASEDLLGAREQVIDSGWQVCSQQPAPGVKVRGTLQSLEGQITFGVVRVSESCPR